MADLEKQPPVRDVAAANIIPADAIDLEELGERNGYVVDLELLKTVTATYQNVKLAQDGHTVLIPQPTDDPDDPLNWSWAKKHAILFVVSATALLPDYGSATGAVTLLPQSASVCSFLVLPCC